MGYKGLFYCANTEIPKCRRLPMPGGTYSRHVSMHDLHPVSRFVQALADLLRDHDRTMLAAGAAKADGQIALAFVDVVRQEIDQKIGNPQNKFLRLRK